MPTLEDGRNAINQGNLQQGRLIFEAILQENPRSEEAWLGLAEVLTETEDKRICYENVLKIDKQNRAAREGLRILEPQADPLIAALQQQGVIRTEEAAPVVSEPTVVTPRPTVVTPTRSDSETPTFILVMVGLALSVVVFALGSGLVYLAIVSFAGG